MSLSENIFIYKIKGSKIFVSWNRAQKAVSWVTCDTKLMVHTYPSRATMAWVRFSDKLKVFSLTQYFTIYFLIHILQVMNNIVFILLVYWPLFLTLFPTVFIKAISNSESMLFIIYSKYEYHLLNMYIVLNL